VSLHHSTDQPSVAHSAVWVWRTPSSLQKELGSDSGSFGRLGGKQSEREEQRPEGFRDQCSETILVVDDIDGVRDLIREVLEMDGYEVLLAEDGRAALQVARQHSGPIHLLLTDVVMPRMGGKELADRMYKDRPDIRVVFMSGYSDEAISRHGVLQPGTAFLKKPFTSDSLTRCIRQILDEA